MTDGNTFFIGNAWVAPLQPGVPLPVVNPATESLLRTTAAGGPADADRALTALPVWAHLPVAQRAAALTRMARGLVARADEFLQHKAVQMPITRSATKTNA